MQSHESRALVQKTVEYCYNKKNHDKNKLRRQWNGLQVHDLKAYNQLSTSAHLRLVICVSLRTAASAQTPSIPMSFSSRLQGVGGGSERAGACKRAVTRKPTLRGRQRT